MLRTKQFGPLSNSARSFLITGTRSNTDGNSCPYSEDETRVSKKQHTRNENLISEKQTTLASRAAARVGPLLLGDAVKVVASKKVERVDCATYSPEVVAAPRTIAGSDSVSYVSDNVVANNDAVHAPPIADQFIRAGIVAVNLLSDLVNYKIPTSDGSGMLKLPQNSMVDPTKPLSNIKPANIKPFRKGNFSRVHAESSANIAAGSNSTSSYQSSRGKGQKSGLVKGQSHVGDTWTRNTVDNQSQPSDTHSKRSIPQKSKAYSNYSTLNSNFNSNARKSDPSFVGDIAGGFSKPPRDMKMIGIAPVCRQFGSSGHVVEHVSRILREMGWGPAAEEALRNLNCLMDAYQANQVLKQIQDHSVALGFFYWLKRQTGFKHDGHTYTTMVGILGRSRQFAAINKLLTEMVRDGCQPNVVTYNRLIHSYGRANYLNEAVNVFERMREAGCQPDRVTYCTLIDIHAKAGYLDVALHMYQKMQEARLSPDTFTYSVIINCLGKAGHLTSAHKLFCEMVEQGCVPNLVTYNIMIALQAKARNYPTALKIYRDMQNAGFEPDKVTYSIVMEVLGHCGHLEEAEAIFTEMKRKNWVPDEPVYGLLVDLWGKAGNVEKSWEWYQAMLNAGLCPNVPTCNSLLSVFLRVHQLSDAYNLLRSMLQLGLQPSLQTYTLLLSCCTEARSSFDMGFCGELMAVTGHPAHTFLLSMPAAGPDGQNVRDHVNKFLDLMHSEERESKRGLIDAVVDFLHKSGLKEEAGSVWEVAARKNVYPDAVREKSSCYWLINLHFMSDGTAVTALSRTLAWLRREMLISGTAPSRIDIVTGWGRRSRVTGASLVRQTVQELLHMFSFPFFTENGNSGCFVGRGEPLGRWLLQSYVERMHLL